MDNLSNTDDEKQLPVFNKTEAAVYVMMGVVDPYQFSSYLFQEEEWSEFPKPKRNPESESVFEFNERMRQWKRDVGMKVRKRLAYYLSEQLKGLPKNEK